MTKMLYPRLALSSIRKNFRFYLPFLFACIGMMMVFYITAFLAESSFVYAQPGGAMISVVLRLGWIILAAFSAIFLFYTNSFLLKRRKNEFGLYNILGMSKTNVSLVLVFENLFILVITLIVGIALGVLFSKFVEILLVNMLGGKNSLDFYVDWKVIGQEVVIYAMLFAMILLKGVHQVSYTSPIKLFTSAKSGEKPPKANIAVTIIGAVLLVAGYVLANIVKSPIYAILAFFGAVVLVIAATFLLFTSGSVFVCKLLKKNKKYYYKTNHFVSTSQMSFRMKRNGAGLASICVLACMALFTIISTSGLYFGSAQIMRKMYPRDLAWVEGSDDGKTAEFIQNKLVELAKEKGVQPKDIVKYRFLKDHSIYGVYRNKKLLTDEELNSMTIDEANALYDTLGETVFYYIPISDYNSVMGTNLSVNRGEALILKLASEPEDETYDLIPVKSELEIEESKAENGETITNKWRKTEYLKGVGTVDNFVVIDGRHLDELSNSEIYNNISIHYRYAFLNDEDFEEQYKRFYEDRNKWAQKLYVENIEGELPEPDTDGDGVVWKRYVDQAIDYYFGMNLDCDDDLIYEILLEASSAYNEFITENKPAPEEIDGVMYRHTNRSYNTGIYEKRSEVFALYSGLFFLGILFCIVFVLAAVLIMYYKQVTEGFEDKSRFEILQKVGMTKAEIRSSINSQVLTLFFTPLLAAGVHIAFAFPLIVKLLMLFGQMDVGFLALVAVICFLLYSTVYVLAYILTSKSNYRIVS